MKLDHDGVVRRCEARGLALSRALREAGVSRTAYYSLKRSGSVLPTTILKLARLLDVPARDLLDDTAMEQKRARKKIEAARRIAGERQGASFENVWHTMVLLDEPPIERLNRALRRGRAGAL